MLYRNVRSSVCYISLYGIMKKNRILGYYAKKRSEIVQLVVPYVVTGNFNRTRNRIKKARQKINQCGFSSAGGADYGNIFTDCRIKIYSLFLPTFSSNGLELIFLKKSEIPSSLTNHFCPIFWPANFPSRIYRLSVFGVTSNLSATSAMSKIAFVPI